MARTQSKRRQQRLIDHLWEKGLTLTLLSLLVVMAPLFLQTAPRLQPVAKALRTPGWVALGIGVLFLVAHFVLKNRQQGSTTQSTAPKPPLISGWSPAVFSAIEWRRFEAVCELLCAQGGYQTRSQSHGADGGVDIWLYLPTGEGPVAAVQCKHWHGKAVGVGQMREFFGVLASHQLTGGIYATTSSYTADARQFASKNGINALDGKALLALIASRTPKQQQALLDVAYEGDYARPTCASCGIKLVERQPAEGGANFWGCSNFPRCKVSLPMRSASR